VPDAAKPAAKTVKVQDVEELIRAINGVTDCRIVTNDWGAVEEIHVLASAERLAKAVARDVESALAARFSMDIDHRKISVAQLGTPPAFVSADYRLRMKRQRVEVDQALGQCTIQIELLTPVSAAISGEATGPNDRHGLQRLAGLATVNAIQSVLAPGRKLLLEDLVTVHVSGREISLALLAVEIGGRAETLIGTALSASGEDVTAAVRACLDAVNRRLGALVPA